MKSTRFVLLFLAVIAFAVGLLAIASPGASPGIYFLVGTIALVGEAIFSAVYRVGEAAREIRADLAIILPRALLPQEREIAPAMAEAARPAPAPPEIVPEPEAVPAQERVLFRTVRCDCGAQLKFPVESKEDRGVCPRCKGYVSLLAEQRA